MPYVEIIVLLLWHLPVCHKMWHDRQPMKPAVGYEPNALTRTRPWRSRITNLKEEGSERTPESLDQKAIEDAKPEVSQELVPQGPPKAYALLVPNPWWSEKAKQETMLRALRPSTLPLPDEVGPSEPQQAGGPQGWLHPPSLQKDEELLSGIVEKLDGGECAVE